MIPISLFVFLTSWLSYPTSFWLRQRLKSSSSLNQSTSYVGVSRVDMCRQLSFNPQRRISAFQQNELRCQALCKDGVSSTNHVVVRAIRFMECREHKVLVDFNYEQLQEEKKGICKHHKEAT